MTAPYPAPAPQATVPWNVLAIIAFVLAFMVPPGAIVCGHIARRQIRTTGEQGDAFALAGLVMGWVFTAIIALFVIIWLGFMLSFLATFGVIFSQIPMTPSPS